MEVLVKSSLSFFSISGDNTVGDLVWPYVNGDSGLFDLLDKHMPKGKYGEDLNLILVALFVEGKEDWFQIPANPKLGRYSKKEKSLRYDIPIKNDNFFCLSKIDRKEFIINHVVDAISAARISFEKKGLHANFEALRADFQEVANAYRARPLPEN